MDNTNFYSSNRITLPHYTCLRCGHEWTPRIETKPMTCAKCRSPYWDIPRKKAGAQ